MSEQETIERPPYCPACGARGRVRVARLSVEGRPGVYTTELWPVPPVDDPEYQGYGGTSGDVVPCPACQPTQRGGTMSEHEKQSLEDVKAAVASHLEQMEAAEPRKYGAVDWRGLLDRVDGLLQKYVPAIGALAPPQVNALARLVAELVHLGNQQVNPAP
jgi:hypothetical protein